MEQSNRPRREANHVAYQQSGERTAGMSAKIYPCCNMQRELNNVHLLYVGILLDQKANIESIFYNQ